MYGNHKGIIVLHIVKKSEKFNILIADDSKEIINQWKVYFANTDLEYDTASDGLEATELFMLNNYDIVLLDIDMPIMTGFEAAKIIRNITPNCFILAISSRIDDTDFNLMFSAGFDAHFPKPLNIDHVMEKVNQFRILQ